MYERRDDKRQLPAIPSLVTVFASVALLTSFVCTGCTDAAQTAASEAVDAGAPEPRSISLRGPLYVRVDWVGRFEAAVCGATGATLRLNWGDTYLDRLDLDIVELGSDDNGCRVFRTSHIYGAVGPFKIEASATWLDGQSLSAAHNVDVLPVPAHQPQHASGLALAAPYAVAVSTDANQLAVFERSTSQEWLFKRRVDTCDGPRTIATNGNYVAVTCPEVDRLQVIKINNGSLHADLELPHGARPYGVVWPKTAPGQKASLFVTLQGRGEVVRIEDKGGGKVALAEALTVVDDARGIAALPDGRLAVTRWRSPAKAGQTALVRWSDKSVKMIDIQRSDIPPTNGASGGVPTYLDVPLVTPDGQQLLLPGTLANNRDGTFRNGTELRPDSTVRAIMARVDLTTEKDVPSDRWLFTKRGLASSGAFSPDGAWLYVTMRGSRAIQRIDLRKNKLSGTIEDIGYAPDAVAVTRDGRWLLALAPLSRKLHTWRVPAFGPFPQAPTKSYDLVENEPLAADVLRGKQLFNDSLDERLAKDGYIACAHCHLDGEADGRTWDMTQAGEGLRQTPSLRGRAGTGHGLLNWSGSADEVHDVEDKLRALFGGTGLLSDQQHDKFKRAIGPMRAGLSKDLDALAAYVASLTTYPRSPFRDLQGQLTPAANKGRALFESKELGCTSCHKGAHLTDSAASTTPNLHDVGTCSTASGPACSDKDKGLDTPTLHALANSAPYLHDGSAATLKDVLGVRNKADKHGKTSHLSAQQIGYLVAYLLQLQGP